MKGEITAKMVKSMVEQELGIYDISVKTKTDNLVFARYITIALCNKFANATSAAIGEVINRDHATVLHGQEEFNKLYDFEKFIPYRNAYHRIYNVLSLPKNKIHYKDLNELKQEHRIKYWSLIQKHHSIQRKLINKIEQLEQELKKYSNGSIQKQRTGGILDDPKSINN